MSGGGNIVLPWPPSELLPNARIHFRRKNAIAQAYKLNCVLLTPKSIPDGTHLSITFNPPDKRRRDLDGMLSSFKWGIDAIAHVMGVDDYQFSLSLRRAEPVKGGRVVIEVGQ